MKVEVFAIFFFFLFIIFSCNSNQQNIYEKDSSVHESETPPVITNLIKQIQKYPDSASLRLQLAATLDSIGRYNEALVQMNFLLKQDSINYGLWYAKAQILEHSKDTIEAEKNYLKAIKVYPSPDALLNLANLYAEQKNKESLLICSRIKDMGQGREYDAHSAFIAGVYNARTGNRDAAIKLFDECIANDYTYMEAYIEKGLIYFDNKQYEQALQVFQFTTTVNNLYADAYYYMARCYEMMSVKDSAVLRFRQSLSLDKTLIEAHEGLKRLNAE